MGKRNKRRRQWKEDTERIEEEEENLPKTKDNKRRSTSRISSAGLKYLHENGIQEDKGDDDYLNLSQYFVPELFEKNGYRLVCITPQHIYHHQLLMPESPSASFLFHMNKERKKSTVNCEQQQGRENSNMEKEKVNLKEKNMKIEEENEEQKNYKQSLKSQGVNKQKKFSSATQRMRLIRLIEKATNAGHFVVLRGYADQKFITPITEFLQQKEVQKTNGQYTTPQNQRKAAGVNVSVMSGKNYSDLLKKN